MEQNYDREAEEFLDALVEMLKKSENGRVKVVNPMRYAQLRKAAADLKVLLHETTEEFEMEVKTDPLFNYGAITVELENMCVANPIAFAQAVCAADNFEVYPLVNGKIRMDITFHAVLETIM